MNLKIAMMTLNNCVGTRQKMTKQQNVRINQENLIYKLIKPGCWVQWCKSSLLLDLEQTADSDD